jgi:signal transduction histidine kinase/ligand-binding sensor domain-containing protein
MQDEEKSTVYRVVHSGRVHLYVDPLELVNSRDLRDLSIRPVTALAQDTRGYLWVGTQNGPMLFDGLVGASSPALAALQGCIIRRFCFAGDHLLWVGMIGKGLALITLGMSGPRLQRRLTQVDGLQDNTVRALCVDQHGTLWAGTQAGIAVIEAGAVVRRLDDRDGLPALQVNALCHDTFGRLWVGTDQGLAIIVDGALHHGLIANPGVATSMVLSLCLDRNGAIWAGLINGDLLRATAGQFGLIHVSLVANCGDPIDDLCADREGRLWLGTRRGAYVYDDGIQQDAFGQQDGLPVTAILALYPDRDGRVWAGTDVGLALLATTPSPVHSLGGRVTPNRLVAWAFTDDSRPDHLWLAAGTGLSRIHKDTGSPLALPELSVALQTTTVWSLCWDQLGQLWAGARRLGLFCLDPVTGAERAHLLFDTRADVPSMCLAGSRQLWIATERQGLLCLDVSTRQITAALGVAEGLPDADIRSLTLDQQGRLWAGTVSGRLVCIDPDRGTILHTLALSGDASPSMVLGLACDAHGLLWACTFGAGIICVDPAQPVVVRSVTMQDGLRSNSVYSCLVDQQRRLWLSTTRGVMRFSPDTGQCLVLDQSLGLPDDDCNSNALHLDPRGWLWVGTARGVGIVDTALVPDAVPPCPVYLTQFRVMGQACDFTSGMVLEDSAYDVQFEYGAVSYVAPALVLYRVQLVGLEVGWSAPTPQRLQRYTNLRPGSYIFRVSACNWGGAWSAPLEAPFQVNRDRQAQLVEEARERERIEAEQLKADLLASSQAQAAAAEELAELRSTFVATVSHELRTPLTTIIGYTDLLRTHWPRLDDAARLSWINRIAAATQRQRRLVEELLLVSRIDLGALINTIEVVPLITLVERAADEVRINYPDQQIAIEGPAPLMVRADPDRALQILMNLLDNAAKYSPEGAPIRVTWAHDGVHAEVLVRDGGTGIPAEGRERLFTRFGRISGSQMRDGHVGTGLGLYLGRSLARAMGGEVELASTGPTGSVFRFLLPLAGGP